MSLSLKCPPRRSRHKKARTRRAFEKHMILTLKSEQQILKNKRGAFPGLAFPFFRDFSFF